MANSRLCLYKFIESRRSKGLADSTIRWYEGILSPFCENCRKLPQKPDAVERYIMSCRGGDERRHGYYRALRAFYRWCHRRLGLKNPVDLIEAPKRSKKSPIFLTADGLDQLLSYPHKPIIKACLLFLSDTGCRVAELANLNPDDFIETPQGYIAKVKGKTGERLVPLSAITRTAIIRFLPLPFTPYRLRIKIARAFKDAHVRGSSKTLRHTFGTLWMGDEFALQRIMGHAYITTTQQYRHLRTEVLNEQHSRHTPLNQVFARTKSML